MKPKVRKGLEFLPGIAWALLIDSLDVFSNAIGVVTLPLFGAGLALDALFDVFQAIFAWWVFDNDPAFFLNAAEIVLPPGFDIFPSTTAIYLAKSANVPLPFIGSISGE